MALTKRRLALPLMLGLALFAAGCAQPPKAPQAAGAGATPSALWTGRLSLQVESDPPQFTSGAFELKGNAAAGELSLFTPLGGTVAVMAWSPGNATLRTANNETRSFDSLDALVTQATGTAVPVTALFDWLAGTNTPVPGWQADLAQLPGGRLAAKRVTPLPPVQLRVILDK